MWTMYLAALNQGALRYLGAGSHELSGGFQLHLVRPIPLYHSERLVLSDFGNVIRPSASAVNQGCLRRFSHFPASWSISRLLQ